MTKFFIFLTSILFSINTAHAQAPKKFDLASPLDIPLILSGTFGELRSNHFHTGLDIKTKGVTGLKVRAIDDGFVSRISISPYGYGKAIYITHANGYTSVYAHLREFSKEIESIIKKEQYKKKRYSITIYPKKNEIKVSKSQIIAKSGNSGGSGGPHLHFEIRDTKTEKPQNPFNFGYKIKDTKKPTINNAFVYSFDNNSGKIISLNELVFDGNPETVDTIYTPSGWSGLGVDSFDRLDYANNKNGVYAVSLKVDNELYFEYKMNSLDFSEQRYINSFIDYAYYKEHKKRIQKLFLDPGNKLSIYDFNFNNGYLFVERNKSYSINIEVEDYKGNKTTTKFVIKGNEKINDIANKSKIVLDYTKDNILETSDIKIKIPKGALYNNIDFDFSKNDSIFQIGDPNVPLQKSYSLELKINKKPDSLTNRMIIGLVISNGKIAYAGGEVEGDYIKTRTRSFGEYVISYDTIAPKVIPLNFRKEQWLSKEKYLKVKITDDLSGIKSYKGYIDDRWIRMEYDAKNSLLKYNLSDLKLKGKKHILKLLVKDNSGNLTEFETIFYRKY